MDTSTGSEQQGDPKVREDHSAIDRIDRLEIGGTTWKAALQLLPRLKITDRELFFNRLGGKLSTLPPHIDFWENVLSSVEPGLPTVSEESRHNFIKNILSAQSNKASIRVGNDRWGHLVEGIENIYCAYQASQQTMSFDEAKDRLEDVESYVVEKRNTGISFTPQKQQTDNETTLLLEKRGNSYQVSLEPPSASDSTKRVKNIRDLHVNDLPLNKTEVMHSYNGMSECIQEKNQCFQKLIERLELNREDFPILSSMSPSVMRKPEAADIKEAVFNKEEIQTVLHGAALPAGVGDSPTEKTEKEVAQIQNLHRLQNVLNGSATKTEISADTYTIRSQSPQGAVSLIPHGTDNQPIEHEEVSLQISSQNKLSLRNLLERKKIFDLDIKFGSSGREVTHDQIAELKDLTLAAQKHEAGKYAEASAIYKRVIECNPNGPHAEKAGHALIDIDADEGFSLYQKSQGSIGVPRR